MMSEQLKNINTLMSRGAGTRRCQCMPLACTAARLEKRGGGKCRPSANIGSTHQLYQTRWILMVKFTGHQLEIHAEKSILKTVQVFRYRISGWICAMSTTRTYASLAIQPRRTLHYYLGLLRHHQIQAILLWTATLGRVPHLRWHLTLNVSGLVLIVAMKLLKPLCAASS